MCGESLRVCDLFFGSTPIWITVTDGSHFIRPRRVIRLYDYVCKGYTRPGPSQSPAHIVRRHEPCTDLTPARAGALAAQYAHRKPSACSSASASLARAPSLSRARALPARTNLTHCDHGATRTATVNQPLSCSAAPGTVARKPQQLRVVGDTFARLRGSAKGVLRGV